MRLPFDSLRWRLQAWHGLLLLLVVAGTIMPMLRLLEDNMLQRVDKELEEDGHQLFRGLMDELNGGPPEEGKPRPFGNPADFVAHLSRPETEVRLPENLAAHYQGTGSGQAYFSIRDRNGRVILESDHVPANLEFLPVPVSGVAESARSAGKSREHLRSVSLGLQMVTGRDLGPEREELRTIGWVAGFTGLGVWMCSLLGGWWLAGRAIRPVRTISETATRIAGGSLSERIDVTAMDRELGDLSRVLNETFGRLEAAFERQRQFTADASHELRTPITILLAETQRILKRERTPEEYREGLTTCSETAQRMRRLVEALLLLARQDGGAGCRTRQETDLRTVLAEAMKHLAPLAREKGRTLESRLGEARCPGDAETLGILASNLIVNALEYGGNVTVTCGSRQGRVWFAVDDDGPGIPQEHLPHLFDRFYRVDQARTGGGHTGLGLAIARAIVENHGGSIQVSSGTGNGTSFEVLLPGAES